MYNMPSKVAFLLPKLPRINANDSDNRCTCLGFLDYCNNIRNYPVCVALTKEFKGSLFTVHAKKSNVQHTW